MYRLALICIFASTLLCLGNWGVMDTSEARYAEIAREMYESGDYLHPKYLGITHYHKPPVTYWITAFSYHLFGGPSTFAARFFLQLSILLQLYLVGRIGYLFYGERVMSRSAVLIYASFIIVWISARNLTTDAYLNTFILASAWVVLKYLREQKSFYLLLLGIMTGLGFLTKATAYLVYIGPILLGLAWMHRKTLRWDWTYPVALLLFLLVGGSWFFALGEEGERVLRYLIFEQSLERYFTDKFQRSEPFWYYLVMLPVLAFPWVLISLIHFFRKKPNRWFENEELLLLSWFIFPVLFFSFSISKLVLYILPAFPALAIYSAKALRGLSSGGTRLWSQIAGGFFFVLFSFLAALPLLCLEYDSSPVQETILLLFLLVLVLAFIKWKPSRFLLHIPALAIAFLLLPSALFLGINAREVPTLQPVAKWIKANKLDRLPVYSYDRLVPSLAFHLDKTTHSIWEDKRSARRETQFDDYPAGHPWYFDINVPTDSIRLQSELKEGGILVSRAGALSYRMRYVETESVQDTLIGKWAVYVLP